MRKTFVTIMAILLLVSIAYAGSPGLIEQKENAKISKNLDDLKKKIDPKTEVKVIITLKEVATDKNINDLQGKLGSFKVKDSKWDEVYPNGFAATVTNKQLEDLRKNPLVARVDIDEELKIALETANYWSGATQARAASPTGYGVDGDRNGNVHNYAPSDIVIAIIDTGIDPMHKDLTGVDNGGNAKIIGWFDAVGGTSTPRDDNGHGTHVASIAAGDGSASSRYKGVAPGAALVGVKVCNYAGSCWGSDIISGLNWVATNKATYGIEIASMSLGGWGSSDGTDPISVASNNVVTAGIVLTIAAGNSGNQKYTISSPGAAEKAITVAAMADPGYSLRSITSAGTEGEPVPPENKNVKDNKPLGQMALSDNGWYLAPFSSRGPTADNRVKPDISAPGVSITAAQAVYPNTASTHGGYVAYSGTSMATPFVAGVAALILDANPSLTPTQVKDTIKGTAEDFGVSGSDIDYGAGRIRAFKAVGRAATGTTPVTDGPTVKHIRTWTSYGDNTPFFVAYPTAVTDDKRPLASTLIQYDWSGYWPGIDLDLAVLDPNGVLVAYSFPWFDRQETFSLSPDSLGNHDVLVIRYIGSGRYALDRSYK